jgi:hypothetical protein
MQDGSILDADTPLSRVKIARRNTALDIYCWLAQRLHRIPAGQPRFIPWTAIYDQFGQGYREVRKFRRDFLKLLVQVKGAYPAAKLSNDSRGLILEASQPPRSEAHCPGWWVVH